VADPVSILFVPVPNRIISIGSIRLDATVREVHERVNTVTNHPVEDGSFVTDHVYEEPLRLLMEGEITNAPLNGALLPGVTDRRIEAYDQLKQLYELRDVVSVVTGLEVYSDLVMTNLITPRDPRTGQRLVFTAEFQRVRKVSSRIVGIAPEKAAPAQRDQVQSEQDIGRQEPAAANNPQAARASVLSRILDLGGGQQ